MANRSTAFFQQNEHQISLLEICCIVLIAGIQESNCGIRINLVFSFQIKGALIGFVIAIQFIQAADDHHIRELCAFHIPVCADILHAIIHWFLGIDLVFVNVAAQCEFCPDCLIVLLVNGEIRPETVSAGFGHIEHSGNMIGLLPCLQRREHIGQCNKS